MESRQSEEKSSLDKELIAFLRARGESYRMWEPKLTNWVNGMSDERESRLLLNALISGLPIPDDERCLDIGCGFGNLVIALSEKFASVAGIEVVEERAGWSQRRCPSAEIVCGTAESLPWADNSFGLITSTDVFEHLDHSQQAVAAKEIARVLKPGGFAFVTVPNIFQIRDEHNEVLFGTWMPNRMRQFVSLKLHGNYLRCWEHTGAGWGRIFERAGLIVKTVPQRSKTVPVLTSRFHLHLRKPLPR